MKLTTALCFWGFSAFLIACSREPQNPLDALLGTYNGECAQWSQYLDPDSGIIQSRDTFEFTFIIVSLDSCYMSNGDLIFDRACHIPGYEMLYSNAMNMHRVYLIRLNTEEKQITYSRQESYGSTAAHTTCVCKKE